MTKTVIYYFSATGNSLAAARYLATKLGVGEPVSIPGSLANGGGAYAPLAGAKAVGFVFPVQRATIPEMLRGFLQQMPVDPSCYYFAVSTYTLFGSNEFWDIDELLSGQGGMLNYAAAVRMMGSVGFMQPSSATIERRLEHMQRQIDEIATAVAFRQENYFHQSSKLLGRAVRAFSKQRRANISFNVSEQCNHCGVCVQVCPAQNIKLPTESGLETVVAPVRSNQCQACLACIHWCPAGAVGTFSGLNMRYHNPMITPEELQGLSQNGNASCNNERHRPRALESALDRELAATLRDDLLAPADPEKWLSESGYPVVLNTKRRAGTLETGGQTMSVEEIAAAVAEIEG